MTMTKTKTKLILVLLALILTTSASMGQIYLGVFGGLNNSKLSGDSPPKGSYKSYLGGNFGALLDVKLGKVLYLSLQPSFSQEGTKVSYSVAGEYEPVDSVKFRLNYFSLPLLLKISNANGRFYAISGLETALLTGNSVKTSSTEEVYDDLAQWNVAAHFGAGINIPLGFPSMFVELRYTQGLVNLTDEPLSNDIIPRVKTSGFKLLCGVKIPLKKSKN